MVSQRKMHQRLREPNGGEKKRRDGREKKNFEREKKKGKGNHAREFLALLFTDMMSNKPVTLSHIYDVDASRIENGSWKKFSGICVFGHYPSIYTVQCVRECSMRLHNVCFNTHR